MGIEIIKKPQADSDAVYKVIESLIALAIAKDKIIQRLEGEIEDLKKAISPPLGGTLNFPSVQTFPFPNLSPLGCIHEYPFPWYGTTPPSCKKCGYTVPNTMIVTCENKNE